MNEEFDKSHLIDSELQVRLMNLVMDEASDFERDQLHQIMEQRSEVAAYYRHLEHLHGLLAEVGAGDPSSDAEKAAASEGWRLSADRRERVLAVLADGNNSAWDAKVTLVKKSSTKRFRINLFEAALVALFAFVTIGLLLPAKQSARQASKGLSRREFVSEDVFGGRDADGDQFGDLFMDDLDGRVPSDQWASQGRHVVPPTSGPASTRFRTDALANAQSAATPSFMSAAPAAPVPVAPAAPAKSAAVLNFEADYSNGQMGSSIVDGEFESRILAREGKKHSVEKQSVERRSRGGQADKAKRLSTPNGKSEAGSQEMTGKPSASGGMMGGTSLGFGIEKALNDDTIISEGKGGVGGGMGGMGGGIGGGMGGMGGGGMGMGSGLAQKPGGTARDAGADFQEVPMDDHSADPFAYEGTKTVRGLSSSIADAKVSPKTELDVVLDYSNIVADKAGRTNVTEGFGPVQIQGLNNFGNSVLSVEQPDTLAVPVTNQAYTVAVPESDLFTNSYIVSPNFSDESTSSAALTVTPRITIQDEEEVRFGSITPESTNAPLAYPSAEHWQELKEKSNGRVSDQSEPNDLARSDEPGRVNQNTASDPEVLNTWSANLLGDVQTEYVESNGQVIARGKKADVARVDKTIEQINQDSNSNSGLQALKQSGAQSTESAANSLWYKKQVDQFQASKSELGEAARSSDFLEASKDATPDLTLHDSLGVHDARVRDQDANGNSRASWRLQAPSPERSLDMGKAISGVRQIEGRLSELDKQSGQGRSESVDRSSGVVAETKPADVMASEVRSKSLRNGTVQLGAEAKLPSLGTLFSTAQPHVAKPPVVQTIDEQSAAKEPFSTFSLHVSDVSFKLAQTALAQGQWPDVSKIRIEEFVNALDYGDPLPCGDEKVACRVEQAIHPFLMQRNLLRVSMRTAATGRSQNTPLRLTILLDNSGSMERADRRQAVLRAFQALTSQLKQTDQVTLISFASVPRLLADKVAGNQGETLLQLIENLPSEGGTNIEAALLLAREKAAEQHLAGAQNRIVLLTDGAVNLGNANPESLAKLVTQLRDAGVAFDAAGISAHDLNDEVLEALTRQGDGRYYLLDSAASADQSFAAQIAGALRPSAQNVKVQVEFNPQRVGRYKLLGYEKHRLNKEDFRNDKVDAAELAASEAGVAVYQYEVKPNGKGDVGSVSVRFRDLTSGQMVEHRWPISYESNIRRLEQSEPSMQLAASAAFFAAKLAGGPLADSVDLAQLQKLLANLPEKSTNQTRVQQLRAMVEQASAIGR